MSLRQNAEPDIWAEEDSYGYVDKLLESAVVPSDGKLYVMFHGTTVEAAVSIINSGFKRSANGTLGPGVYVSRQFNKAANYPYGMSGKNVVLRVRVNVGRVIKIDSPGHPRQINWHSHYDTAWIPPRSNVGVGGLEEDCIANPTRIKVIDVDLAPSEEIRSQLKQLVIKKNKKLR